MLLALALAVGEPAIIPFDTVDFNKLKQTVGVYLKDDQSARWKLQQPTTLTVYCGWVNAKNSFGAYNGWEPFAIGYIKFSDDHARFISVPLFRRDPEDALAIFYFSECEKSGFSLDAPPAIPDS